MVFEITQSDTEPALRAILKDADGKKAVVNAGDVVLFRMRPVIAGLRADISSQATVNDGSAGDVEYRWTALDTAVPGLYEAEFHVTRALGAGEKTFPNDEFIRVIIKPKAATQP